MIMIMGGVFFGCFRQHEAKEERSCLGDDMLGMDTIAEVGGSGTIRVRLPSSAPAPLDNVGAGGVPVVPFSPRIKTDPVAGVMIAEYLSSVGEKEIQIPSQTVVAYLRSGLTATGVPEKRETATAIDA